MIRSAVIFLVSCLLLAVGMSPTGAMCLPRERIPAARPDATSILSGHTWLPPVAETITYDASGNRRSTALWSYRWNSRNQLVTAATKDIAGSPEGWRVTFDYDAEGRRFKKQVIHKTTADGAAATTIENIYFIWDGWNLIYERHENQYGMRLWDRQYIWGEDLAGGTDGAEGCGGAGALLLIRDHRDMTDPAAYTDHYPCYDTSGHLIALTDTTGAPVATYDYGPFGEQLAAAGPAAAANPFRYATKYYDAETGLYYFGHRYYDPNTAQWLSRELLGESESLNLYSYCHNDPVNSVDILGLDRTETVSRPDFGYDVDYIFEFWADTGGWFHRLTHFGRSRYEIHDSVRVRIGTTDDQINGTIRFLDCITRNRDIRLLEIDAIARETGRAGDYLKYRPDEPLKAVARLYHANYKPLKGDPIALAAGFVDTVLPVHSILNAVGIEANSPSVATMEHGFLSFDPCGGDYFLGGTGGELTTYGLLVYGAVKASVAKSLQLAGYEASPAAARGGEKLSRTFGSFDDYWRASNPQARIDALVEEYGLAKHASGKQIVYGGERWGVSGGVDPLNPNIIKIYDEGMSLGDRWFVETFIEEAHHSKLMKLVPETGLRRNAAWWESVVEPRAKDYARRYADRLFGK